MELLRTIDELARVFNKIECGEATEEDLIEYDVSIKASCMNPVFLEKQIKERAKKMKVE